MYSCGIDLGFASGVGAFLFAICLLLFCRVFRSWLDLFCHIADAFCALFSFTYTSISMMRSPSCREQARRAIKRLLTYPGPCALSLPLLGGPWVVISGGYKS